MRGPRLGRRGCRWVLAVTLAAATVPGPAHANPKAAQTIYEVKAGDTLGAIAKRFRVSLRALIEANHLRQPDALRLGQRLVVPASGGPAAPREPTRPVVSPPANFVLTAPDLDGEVPAFRWPVEGVISSPFGRRRSGWHAGIDIKADLGTPVFSAAGGTVLFSGWEKYYGRVVKIEHDGGFLTVYAHNLQNFVEAGDVVEPGQVIASVGRSGRASTYHLHFEVRNNGKILNPLFLLPDHELQFVSNGESQPDEGTEAP